MGQDSPARRRSRATVSRAPRRARPQTRSAAPGFEADARPVLEALCRTVACIVDALPDVQNARRLQQSLDLDYALAWQVYRLATAVDPLAAGVNVPRRAPWERFLNSAQRSRVGRARIDAARAAYEQYDRLIYRHATERGAFDSLIAGLRREAAVSLDLKQRRAAFRANAHLWGTQLAARIQIAFYVPDVASGPDSVSVAGWVGLSASRVNAGLTVPVSNYMRSIDPVEGRAPRIEASGRQSRGIELLSEFSTPGLPRFESVRQPDGRELGNLRLIGLGRASALTFFMLASAARACDDPVLGVGTLLRVPSRTLLSDVFVAEGCSDPASAELAQYARADLVDQTAERRPEDRLPSSAAVTYIASAAEAPRTPEFPQYPELVRHVLKRMGWTGLRFDLYRTRIEYPLLHGFAELSVRQRPE